MAWIWLLFFFAFATFTVFVVRNENALNAEREKSYRRLVAAGDLDGWGARLGLESRSVSASAGGATGHWSGALVHDGVAVTLSVSASCVEELHATAERPPASMTLTADLGGRAPAGITARRNSMSTWADLSASVRFSPAFEGFDVQGDPVVLSAFSAFDVLPSLRGLATMKDFAVELSGGRLEVVISGWDTSEFVVEEEKMREVLDAILAAIDASPTHYDEADALAAVLQDQDRPMKARWRAASALFERHVKSEAVARLAASLDTLDATTRAACACWGSYPAVELTPERRHALLVAMAEDEVAGEDVRGALSTQVGWLALCDQRLDPATRREAARRALRDRAAPRDEAARDAALVALFTSESSNLGERGAVLRGLTRSGWDVTGAHAEALACSDDASVHDQLLEHFLRRGVRHEDAAALAALAQAGTSGAEGALIGLKSSASAGMLSLSEDDATRGALSQTAERGMLTPHGTGEET